MKEKEFDEFLNAMGLSNQDCDYLKKPFVQTEGIIDLMTRIIKHPNDKKYIKLNNKFLSLWHDEFKEILRERRRKNLKLMIRKSCLSLESMQRYEEILKRYGGYNMVMGVNGRYPEPLEEFERFIKDIVDGLITYFDNYDRDIDVKIIK